MDSLENIFPKDIENIILDYSSPTEYEKIIDDFFNNFNNIKEYYYRHSTCFKVSLDIDFLKEQILNISAVCVGYEKVKINKLKREILNFQNILKIDSF